MQGILAYCPRREVYHVEQYNHQLVIYIGYRANATTETVKFQRFVEEIFRQRLEQEHERAIQKASRVRLQKVTHFVINGMTESHAILRVDMSDIFKELSELICRVSSPKMIGAVVSQEYIILFGKLATELKKVLNTKNIRDALPEIQLEYLSLAERGLVAVLSRKDRMTNEELIRIVVRVVKPLAEHLKTMCELLGIDLVTGISLLKA